MKEMAKKTYSKKGDAIVQLNYKAIDAGKDAIEEVAVDNSWSDLMQRMQIEELYLFFFPYQFQQLI